MSIRFTNMKKFLKDMQAAADAVPEHAVKIQKKIALDLLRRVVKKTPVDTGRARGGWQLTINEIPSEVYHSSKPAADGISALSGLPFGAIVYLTNNVEYIEYLEYGSSDQAPHGMLAVSLEELEGTFDDLR